MTRRRGTFQKKLTNVGSEQPTEHIPTRLRPKHAKDNAPTDTEMSQLMKACENSFETVVLALAGHCGMREGEIAHCEKTWIDWNKGVVNIPAKQECGCSECVRIRGGYWSPKTDVGKRQIPIRKDGLLAIQRYFATEDKIGCTRQTVYKTIMRVARRVNIPKVIHPHALRSAYASYFGNRGVGNTALCKIMGWKKMETANTYCTIDNDVAVSVCKAVDR